ncbi:hypothetical protein SAMN05216525_105156 [Bradyrhizobium sp. Gha]|nr:hypothetical protein SAMN05216525_105156 [Bradyrhizobium sp. Gha]
MVPVLSKDRVRPKIVRTERYEGNGGRKQPGDKPKKSGNNH